VKAVFASGWLSKFAMENVIFTSVQLYKDGIVRKIWHKVKPDEHAGEVLQAVDELGL
jgi:peroxiredoxin